MVVKRTATNSLNQNSTPRHQNYNDWVMRLKEMREENRSSSMNFKNIIPNYKLRWRQKMENLRCSLVKYLSYNHNVLNSWENLTVCWKHMSNLWHKQLLYQKKLISIKTMPEESIFLELSLTVWIKSIGDWRMITKQCVSNMPITLVLKRRNRNSV